MPGAKVMQPGPIVDPRLRSAGPSALLHTSSASSCASTDDQLEDSRLLGRERLVPDGGEVGEQDCDLTLGDLVLALSLHQAIRCRRASAGPQHVHRNGSPIGTITFGIGASAGTFATAGGGAETFAAGDRLAIINENPADATLADLSITFLGKRT